MTGIRLALLAAAALAWAPLTGQAQEAVRLAQASPAPRSFSIPAGPLAQALPAFGAAASLRILALTENVGDRRTQGVSGTLPPEEALRQLLAGTGLTYRFTDAATVTLLPLPGSGALELPEVRVDAGLPRAYSPLRSYVAAVSETATKTETSLLETPQALSVIGRPEIEARQPHSISQALRYTPGITADYRGSVNHYDVLYARGFGGFNIIYQDGMRLLFGNYAIAQPDPYTIERVEVFRGPTSVLYGQNNPGGMVNLVTRRPPAEPVHEIQLQAGSFGRITGGFDLGGPLGESGQWLYRLTSLAGRADSQVDHIEESRISLSPALTWRPSADTSLTLLGNYQRDPEGGFFGFVPAQGSFLPNPNGRIPTSFYDGEPGFEYFRRKQIQAGYLFEHRFDEVFTLRQNLRYQHMDVQWGRVASAGLRADLRTLNREANTDDESLAGLTVDTQLQARLQTGPVQHTLLAGVDYQWSSNQYAIGSAAAPPLDILTPVYGAAIARPPVYLSINQRADQIGLYLQDQIRFGRWSLLLGGRHDWADTRSTDRLLDRTTRQSDGAFTSRVGLVHTFDIGLAPYVSYSTSFQPVLGSDFSGAAFRPTRGEQYEVGIRYQPTGMDSYLAASLFHLTQQNVTTTDPAHPSFSVQTGEIRSRGLELEAKASLASGLNVTLAATFLDPEVTRSNTANLGHRPIGIPRITASAWADYTFQDGPLRGLGLGGGVRHVGRTAGDAVNFYSVPSYTLVDAMIRYDLGELSPGLRGARITINANNLGDEQYVSSCSRAPNNCYYGLRRTVLGTLSYRW
ncbi:TonB-dependent siderophore receptor [Siccirubricoccus phaeus]|uniref:TonB-dependent siderophore receptor n=1 Tax=Siccirubricoccus phaeus TaxID=2595053 RepID=UPI0011F3A073|nr:TonB-dependent siderophore receptor [Siccirubricoccus phaeus]